MSSAEIYVGRRENFFNDQLFCPYINDSILVSHLFNLCYKVSSIKQIGKLLEKW